MHLTIPPPIVGLITAFLMWVLHYAFPEADFTFALFRYVGFLLIFIGLAIDVSSILRFFKAKTTVNPLKPERSDKLVTHGLYQYSRNPMYLGMCIALLGFGFWLANPLSFFPIIGFVWYICEYQIKPEEKVLERLFGQEYATYKMQVRRWL